MLDQELLFKIAAGDRRAFLLLFEKHKGLVYGICRRYMGADMSAQDMAQEAWMRIVQSAGSYKPTGSAKSWILTIARNLCLNELKRSKWEQAIEPSEFNNKVFDDLDLEKDLIKNQDLSLLKAAMDELPAQQRAVLLMALSDNEISQSEMAEACGLSVNNFKVILFRAKKSLEEMLKEGSHG
jgi:RNA polymerase sigma-70 factor (ECF subfamily)